MDDSPKVPDLGKGIEDVVTLSGDPKRLIAKKTVNAYTKGTIATVAKAMLALGAVSVGPGLSTEQPIRKPDEHVMVQTQENASVTHELETLVVGSTGGDRMWSDDDSTPMWSGNDFAPLWGSRADRVRFNRVG